MCIAAATLYLAQALRYGVHKNALILAWHLCMASEYAGVAFTQQSTLGLIQTQCLRLPTVCTQ